MLQDFERGRRTEVDFINGYVSDLGARMGVPVPINAAIAATVIPHRREAALAGPRAACRSAARGRKAA